MRVGNFTVVVPQGREKDSGHVLIPHNTKYTIRLSNHWHDRRCDATVTIDGKDMGTFRLDNYGQITLERPVHDEGCFTFYKADTAEYAKASGGEVSPDLRGLVQVVFKPEKKQFAHLVPRSVGVPKGAWDKQGGALYGMPMNCSAPPTKSVPLEREEKTCGGILTTRSATGAGGQAQAGVTGLSGHSGQKFLEVAELEYDPAEEVTVSLRLAAWDDGPRPLTNAVPKSNPVPAPVA